MRLRVLTLPALLALAVGFYPGADDAPPVPRYANITAACNPSGNPSVNPARINMNRVDHIEWRAQSPRVASFTISPKDPANWPFAQASFSGTGEAPAVTPSPVAGARANHSYAYNVTIQCTDGSTQIIDPDIIIGDAE
jgi:hypothetical protein